MRAILCLSAIFLVGVSVGQSSYKPSPTELRASYDRANKFQDLARDACFNLTLRPAWVGDRDQLLYRRDSAGGVKEFFLVDPENGARRPAFDAKRLADALSKATGTKVDPQRLPFQVVTMAADLASITFEVGLQSWQCSLATYELTKIPNPSPTSPGGQRQQNPPRNARIGDGGQVQYRADNASPWTTLTKLGSYESVHPCGDKEHLLAFRVILGDRRLVYLLKSSVPGTTRAQLESRVYPQPGDKLDTYEPYIIDIAGKTETKVAIDPLMEADRVEAWGTQMIVATPVRGYQGYQVIEISPRTASAKVVVDERSNTFVDISKAQMQLLKDGRRLIWQSESDGWSHLYLVDTQTGEVRQIDKGNWVMRKLESVDESKGEIWFSASGLGVLTASGIISQDPYHIHECRINLDGTGFLDLTPGDGTHTVQYSPDHKFLVDTYSRVDHAPIHELRRAEDGKLIATLEKADITQLLKNKVPLPERFVAKARDGKTDIWGVVIRPTNFDPRKKYPVIENIYAGPQDSFVPKAFRPFINMNRLAELGFIVVQIDGMGTDNRGKAFHDVCWKNLADAGFPDRILWLQALAKKYPQVDISRVGIYGTSAGGQNSTGAVLFHPEFYKVAVSSCGCHDNRIDKQWWNEQWMGLPVGKEYDDASNITNAYRLKGHLLLFVGENDRNVPPESTYRLCDALIKANKAFDMLVIPGADHTDGGVYGERKRRDYFVKWLLGVDPPDWNQ